MKEKIEQSVNPVLKQTGRIELPRRRGLGYWKVFSLIGFIAVNAVLPIGGLFFLDWNLYEIAVLYWTENLIIGVFMVMQLLGADAGSLDNDKKLFGAIPALLVYFPLCLGQVILIQFLFQKMRTDIPFEGWPVGWYAIADLLHMAFIQMMWPAIAMVANYSFVYVRDYIQAGECFRATVGRLTFIPIIRLIMMQVLVMAGLALKKSDSSLLPLFAIMIGLKILIEWLFDFYNQRNTRLYPCG
jgi:hypothetical protein